MTSFAKCENLNYFTQLCFSNQSKVKEDQSIKICLLHN